MLGGAEFNGEPRFNRSIGSEQYLLPRLHRVGHVV
jgi:hypothetical protein